MSLSFFFTAVFTKSDFIASWLLFQGDMPFCLQKCRGCGKTFSQNHVFHVRTQLMITKFSLSLFALQLLEVAEMVNPLSKDHPNQTTYYKNIADMMINPFDLFSEDEGEVIIITFLREFSSNSRATSRIFVNSPLTKPRSVFLRASMLK